MPKFFIDETAYQNDKIVITGEDYHHIIKVHRKKIGDEITLCDGKGMDMQCEIREITKDGIFLSILEQYACKAEPKTKIILFQGIPKQGKMETIIQKTTELGVFSVVPVQMHRSVVRLDKKDTKKKERWQRVALEAAKQCGRGYIPVIDDVITFEEAIEKMEQMQYAFMPYENETKHTLSEVLPSDINEIGIIIGPEGGFEQSEVEFALSKGIKTVTLGERILRTETVGAALLPIILYHMNDL